MSHYSAYLTNRFILSQSSVTQLVISKIKKKEVILLTYINAHCFNLYVNNPNYAGIINKYFSIYPDGVGMWLYLNLHGLKYKKFNATDTNAEIMNFIIQSQITILYIGGAFNSDSFFQQTFKKGIKLSGYVNGFLSQEEIIKECKKYHFDIAIIGMGAPIQEEVGLKLLKEFEDKTIICVGNFMNFYLGFQPRAPRFLQNAGLEWLFRLITNPYELWRRYLFGIPLFFLYLIKLKFFNFFKKE